MYHSTGIEDLKAVKEEVPAIHSINIPRSPDSRWIVWCVAPQGRVVTTQKPHQLTTTNQFFLITMRSIILFLSIVLVNSPSSNCDRQNRQGVVK